MPALISVGTSPSGLTPITPDPAELTWGLQDISTADAGRTQSGKMYKMYVTQKRKLQLSWVLPTAAQASAILQAFNHEYFYVRYFDVLDGRLETREFYVGDRTAPFKWYNLPGKGTRMASLKFDVIER
jgi:hypothetical protein